MTPAADPCLTCSIDQDCCAHMHGLKLSRAEYERCFAHHGSRVTTHRRGPIYIVSAADGGACPNWVGGRCSIYDVRPMECRLFPYSGAIIVLDSTRVDLAFHSMTRCPAKEQLLPSEDVARKMVSDWAREAFAGLELGPVFRDTRSKRWLRLPWRAMRRLRRIMSRGRS